MSETIALRVAENGGTVPLVAEQARVIRAVSPTATVERIEGGAKVTITDYEHTTMAVIHDGPKGDPGEPGRPGNPGQPGVSPTASVTQTEAGATVTVTDASGTTTANLTNGQDGEPGQDGISPTIAVTDIPGGHRVTITDATGPHSFDVMDGDSADAPVQDVRVNGVSALTDGVANVPIATTANRLWGVAKVGNGLYADNNGWHTNRALDNAIKEGKGTYLPLTPSNQQVSTFYGLAKAAGSDEKNSTLPIGQYTDNAKDKIQQMLGIIDMIAPHEGAQAANAYSVGGAFCNSGKLYKATASIAVGDAIVPGTNCTQTTLIELIGGI